MDASIIIISWNTRDLLIECINSVYSTTREINFDIWVVDNGSSDGSVRALRNLFPDVSVIENQFNLGFAKACNQALKLIESKYTILLNTDTILTDGAIKTVLDLMEKDSDIGLCGVQLLNPDGTKQNSIANIPSLATELLNKSLLRRLFPKKYPGKERDFAAPVEVESIIGAFMAVRKEAMDEVGMLDESYFFFFEETDWCLRMKKKGWKVVHHPGSKVYHLQGQTVKKINIRARIEYWKSRYLFFKKNYGGTIFAALLVGLMMKLSVNLVLNLVLACVSAFTNKRAVEKSKLYLNILYWHLSGLPEGRGLNTR
jgi:GT2 family glycosyltransferase